MKTCFYVLLLLGGAHLKARVRADIALSTASSGSRVCCHDGVRIAWALADWSGGEELVWVELHDVSRSNSTVARFDLFQYGHSNREPSTSLTALDPSPPLLQRFHSVIHCWDNGPFQIPEVRTVEWRSGDGEPFIVLRFSSSTNRPALRNSAGINNALVFNHGDIEVFAGKGLWSSDGEALNITELDPGSWKAITASISNGTFHVKPREKLLVGSEGWEMDIGTGGESPTGQLRGNLTMRMSFPGQFAAHLFVGDILESTSSQVIRVDVCPDQVFVAAPKVAPSVDIEVPGPFFAADGVLALPGEKRLKIPSSLFTGQLEQPGRLFQSTEMAPEENLGSWTFASWICLLDDAAGGSLFYKGDGGSMGQTPSAWIYPKSKRIRLRVTSETDPDIGADSVASVPPRSWSHVTFTFDNNTDGGFVANVFINGTLDISAGFRPRILSNTGPLHIGRDPINLGPRSLVAMVRLWKGALSPDQVTSVFRASRPLFVGEASPSLASRYFSINAVVSMTSSAMRHGLFADESNGEGASFDPSQDQLGDSAFEAAMAATVQCKTYSERLDLYRLAAEAGHTSSRVRYASLLLIGREEFDGGVVSLCGREKEADARSTAVLDWNAGGAKTAVEHLEQAVEDGSHQAAFMLATIMLSGLGGVAHDGRSADYAGRSYRASSSFQQLPLVGSGAAVLDQRSSSANSNRREEEYEGVLKTWDVPVTARAIALLHFAAVGDHSEAQLALGLRYLEGHGVQLDFETAAFFLACASDVSHAEYHRIGQQPIVEIQRLTAENEATVEIGQKGENDDAIQYQIHRASQGHVPSMEALGDIFYWGARGVPRDQTRALKYFSSAGDAGSNNARCAAAGMYLKGEGADANHTKALELFELAAEENHVRALNGLGYVYFNGHVLPQNFTRAYSYFERAANFQQDGDSLFNAAHCLAHGIGTDQDRKRAAELFHLGAEWGHVDSAYELGYMYTQGTGVERNPGHAAKYFSKVAQVGPWGQRLRLAFDSYLLGDVLSALALYAQVAELGYEVAASNAAYLLDRGKVRLDDGVFQGNGSEPVWVETMSVRLHVMAALKGRTPSYLAIGDAFFDGKGGLPRDSTSACWWYMRASSSGMARGSYNLGYMYEFGLGVPLDHAKALMFYDRARDSPASTVADVDQNLDGMPIQLLILIVKARFYLNSAFGGWLGSLWRRENEEGHTRTQNSLPEWVFLSALSDTSNSIVRWIGAVWNGPKVLGHNSTQDIGLSSHRISSTPDKPLQSENILLIVLSSMLLTLFVTHRRNRLSIHIPIIYE